MGWTGNRQRLIFAAAALALHVLLIAIVLSAGRLAFLATPARETVLLLTPIARPPKPVEKKSRAPSIAPRPSAITATPPRPFAWPPVPDSQSNALQGFGASLGCGAFHDGILDAEHRAACRHGPWTYDHDAKETASLIIEAPHVTSAAERAARIRSTVDPCAAEKLTHQTDCISKIIYGDKLP